MPFGVATVLLVVVCDQIRAQLWAQAITARGHFVGPTWVSVGSGNVCLGMSQGRRG